MTRCSQILIVDDEPFNRDLLEQELETLGCDMETAADGREAIAKLSYGFPGVLVTDVRMPRIDGLELLRRTLELDSEVPVILLTAYGDIAMAVQAMRDGAYDFIARPCDADRLREMVTRALSARSLVLENRALRAELKALSGLDARIRGGSPLMTELRRAVVNVADTGANVLIRGETGTGKELVARALHDLSRRRQRRFVPVNCAAMPETLFESELFGHEAGAFTGATKRRTGKFEHAHGGTLFLDEIESLPLGLQAKLLRVLQEREIERLGSNEVVRVDIRLVVATQLDLGQAVEQGGFREDLYYRLDVAEIHIPPLRDRREDIPALFQSFVQELSALHGRTVPGLSPAELHELMAHSWSGNVRELRNVAERHVLGLHPKGAALTQLLHPAEQAPLPLAEQLDAFERCVLEQELAKQKGNIQATAKALVLPVRTLNDRLRRHGLNRKTYL